MGEYDYNNMMFQKEVIRNQGGTFIDVGANIGIYSLLVSEEANANVICIEPHPRTYKQLLDNISENNRKNVSGINAALSDFSGQIALTNEKESTIHTVIKTFGNQSNIIIVNCFTLDQVLIENPIVFPLFLKIDVEGNELDVINGGKNSLSKFSYIQLEGGERNEVMNILHQNGFQGPYYPQINGHKLQVKPQKRPEDPIFINQKFFPVINLLGWEICDD
jgi:FkbM family methyltransferase